MSLKGCNHGCTHRKEIKIEEMKEFYVFRCDAVKKYFTKDDIKCRCSLYRGSFTVKEHSVEEFLQ